jgi:hypothetical protein
MIKNNNYRDRQMNINKITITPINRYCRPFVIKEPSQNEATLLITDRLRCNHGKSTFRKKLPAILKDFVNTKCWVASSNKPEKNLV